MKLFAFLKMSFKSYTSSFLSYLSYFFILPITMTFIIGYMSSSGFESPNTTETMLIYITNNDNTSASNDLINYISDELGVLFEISENKDDALIEIVIPKGYESSLLENSNSSIAIKELEQLNLPSKQLKNLLDNYHENIYLNSLYNTNEFNTLFSTPAIDEQLIEPNVVYSTYEPLSISMFGLTVMMFITTGVSAFYTGECSGLNKRNYSLPLKRTSLLLYNSITTCLSSFFFLMIYAMFFRLLGISFLGDFYLLLILCFIISIFIACVSSFIVVFLSRIFGLYIVNIVFILQIVLGGTFSSLVESMGALSRFSPFTLIADLVSNYSTYNTFSSILGSILILLSISMVLYCLSFVKEKYSWREV